MEYSKLVAVTGMPGLYELISSKNDGAIVRSLDDNSTKFAASRIHNFSHLESIEIYTTGENVNLVEIFHAMEKTGGALPDGKDNTSLIKYFETTYPELDFERVYPSDLKKMIKWFEALKKNKIEIKLSELPEEEEEQEETPAPAPKKAAKEAKEETTKDSKPAKEVKETKTVKAETAKKTPAKSVKKEKEEKPVAKKAAAKETKSAKKEATPAKKKTPPKKK
jgi:hypothetical protein